MQAADEANKKEELLKQVFKEYPLEQPEADFTDRFMKRLEEEIAFSPTSGYSPLISIRSGAVIAVFCIALIVASTTLEIRQTLFSIRLFDLVSIEWPAWNQLTERIGTSIMIYAMIVLFIGMGIQFYFLKQWHARQIYQA